MMSSLGWCCAFGGPCSIWGRLFILGSCCLTSALPDLLLHWSDVSLSIEHVTFSYILVACPVATCWDALDVAVAFLPGSCCASSRLAGGVVGDLFAVGSWPKNSGSHWLRIRDGTTAKNRGYTTNYWLEWLVDWQILFQRGWNQPEEQYRTVHKWYTSRLAGSATEIKIFVFGFWAWSIFGMDRCQDVQHSAVHGGES